MTEYIYKVKQIFFEKKGLKLLAESEMAMLKLTVS
jgi:hypothetical protein